MTMDELNEYLEQLQRARDEAKRETTVPQEIREKIERLQQVKLWLQIKEGKR